MKNKIDWSIKSVGYNIEGGGNIIDDREWSGEWFDKNWDEMDDEGKCCWENYCANMVESLNFYL